MKITGGCLLSVEYIHYAPRFLSVLFLPSFGDVLGSLHDPFDEEVESEEGSQHQHQASHRDVGYTVNRYIERGRE